MKPRSAEFPVVQDFLCKFYDERGTPREERTIASNQLNHATASARCIANMLGVSAFEVWQRDQRLHREQAGPTPPDGKALN